MDPRIYDPATIDPQYACPFCIRVAFPTTDALMDHVGACDFYHALDENLPVSPASAIVVDPDIPYTLEEYLSDEILYFQLMKSVSAAWPSADAPADLAAAEEYFANVISAAAANTRAPLTAQRAKNLVFRLITTFYTLPQHLIETYMASMYDIQVGSADNDLDST